MKIAFIAPANNYHTQKWCEFFVSRGYDVSVISFFPGQIDNVDVYHIDCGVKASNSDKEKLVYLIQARKIKTLIKSINPEIISVHYASSYGAVMALTGIKDYYLSVWGSEVYEFPEKSIFHKWLIMFSLKRAKYILSTSKAMAEQTKKYTSKEILVTPFGVKTDLFKPQNNTHDLEKLVIGTVKALEPKYGIDYLIKAVSQFKKKCPTISFQLRIAGKGNYQEEYEKLAIEEGIGEETIWLGFISQEKVAEEWAKMDIAVIPSTLESESFGVSAVEAQACGIPVIISDIPGLMEATNPGVTSIVCNRKDKDSLERAIEILAFDKAKRRSMGEAGRDFVEKKYEYNKCFEWIERIFLNNI